MERRAHFEHSHPWFICIKQLPFANEAMDFLNTTFILGDIKLRFIPTSGSVRVDFTLRHCSAEEAFKSTAACITLQ